MKKRTVKTRRIPAPSGVEVDIHVWKKPADAATVDLYTISVGKYGICIDCPIDRALDSMRNYLENDLS